MNEKSKVDIDKQIKSLEIALEKNKQNLKTIDEAEETWSSLKKDYESILEDFNDSWKGEKATRFQNQNYETIETAYKSARKNNEALKEQLLEEQKQLNKEKKDLEKEKNKEEKEKENR